MKSLLLTLSLLFSASVFADVNVDPSKSDILEVLNVLLKPVQNEMQAGVSDISQAVELQKFMEFLNSGNKIVGVTKEVESTDKVHYYIDNVECKKSKCSTRGAYYIVTVETKNGKINYSALHQNH